MPITRDQATRLLTQSEMGLFGDSRNPALRALSEKALSSRVERTRKLRDKSRDLLQRQKLKSRERTGSKLGTSGDANVRTGKKGEILDDMLQRFETRLQDILAADEPILKKRATSSAKPHKATKAAKATATAKSARSRKTATAQLGKSGNRAGTRAAAKDGPGGANVGIKPKATRAVGKKTITTKRALKNTLALLDAKQQRNRQPRAYLAIDSHSATGQPSPGFQSGAAKSRSQELHEGEIRMEPIHGSISTQGRKNQGKRDKN